MHKYILCVLTHHLLLLETDLVEQAVYESIPVDERKCLHRAIGMSLLGAATITNDTTIYLLAVDQINIFAADAILTPEERHLCAEINANAAAAKMASSIFQQGWYCT